MPLKHLTIYIYRDPVRAGLPLQHDRGRPRRQLLRGTTPVRVESLVDPQAEQAAGTQFNAKIFLKIFNFSPVESLVL